MLLHTSQPKAAASRLLAIAASLLKSSNREEGMMLPLL
jgi:hypothetical protein